jgi:hypothetical protein
MLVPRRTILALPAGLSAVPARGDQPPPGADPGIQLRIVLNTPDPDATLRISQPVPADPIPVTAMDKQKDSVAYAAQLRKLACITDYDCEIKWTDGFADTIRLWVFWFDKENLMLPLRQPDRPAVRTTIDELDRLPVENSLDEAMRCYIGGRRIFNELAGTSSSNSRLAIAALRIWLTGALAASTHVRSLGRDEHVVKSVDEFRGQAARGGAFAGRWARDFEGFGNCRENFDLYKTIEFGQYAKIDALIEQDDRQSAKLLVDELLRRLDGTQGTVATEVRKIRREQLVAYRDRLRA